MNFKALYFHLFETYPSYFWKKYKIVTIVKFSNSLFDFRWTRGKNLHSWVFVRIKTSVIASVSWFMEIGLRKWNYFGVKKIFFENFDLINECKMNLWIVTKNRAADPGIRFLIKSILEPYGRATTKPTGWELIELERLYR